MDGAETIWTMRRTAGLPPIPASPCFCIGRPCPGGPGGCSMGRCNTIVTPGWATRLQPSVYIVGVILSGLATGKNRERCGAHCSPLTTASVLRANDRASDCASDRECDRRCGQARAASPSEAPSHHGERKTADQHRVGCYVPKQRIRFLKTKSCANSHQGSRAQIEGDNEHDDIRRA